MSFGEKERGSGENAPFVEKVKNNGKKIYIPPTDPPDEACPAQLQQPLVQLVDVAPLSAKLVGGVCTAVWEFPAL